MEYDYDRLLAICYELEGLMTLASTRRETTPPQVHAMMQDKIEQLRVGLSGSSDVKEQSNEEQPIAAVEEINVDIQPEVMEEAIPVTIIEAPTVVMPEQEITVKEESATIQPEEENIEPEEEDNEHVSEPTESSPVTIMADKFAPISFTLNDKFRFRRELFGNSDIDFADALNVVDAMNSLDELEDYFYNDLCWDPNDENVIDFMSIVGARFK